ncbi:hypothetical protein BX600DRAFT_63225 [Xylariales sp. PMI_506]|nr:hypothetical protein BX600DRAFT_63225 [Xylariales sp. PMI_506]
MTVTIGPLTTTFTPPASCTNDFTNYYQMWTGDLGVFDIAGPYTTESCFPSGYNPARSEYYSPGICPAGYKTACSSVDTNGVTAVTCCPPYVFILV